jgi:small GTP-binding protein
MNEVIIDEDGNEKIKVILIGDSGVGKTNLINVANGGKFDEDTRATLTASFVKIHIDVNKRGHNLYLWDTIGQERLRSLTKIFFKDSRIVIFVYDVTTRTSFENLPDWVKEVNDSLGNNYIKGVVGNKIDLFLNEQVKEQEAESYAQSIGAKLCSTSAKTDSKGFYEFLKTLVEDYDKVNSKNVPNNDNHKKIQLNPEEQKKKKDKKCCK